MRKRRKIDDNFSQLLSKITLRSRKLELEFSTIASDEHDSRQVIVE